MTKSVNLKSGRYAVTAEAEEDGGRLSHLL